jgi:Rad3-related DNA helicase
MINRLNKLKSQLDHFAGFDFRPGQVEAIKFALESQRKIRVLTAPTGSGKSLAGIITGMDQGRFLYLCSSKQLQSQLEKEFPECRVMWGRNNFPCVAFEGLNASECPHKTVSMQTASERTRDMVKLCKVKCPYEIRKREVLEHKFQILNYSYFLFEANFVGRFSEYPLIICDEADTIEGILSTLSYLEFRHTSWTCLRLNRLNAKRLSRSPVSSPGRSGQRRQRQRFQAGTRSSRVSLTVWSRTISDSRVLARRLSRLTTLYSSWVCSLNRWMTAGCLMRLRTSVVKQQLMSSNQHG